jgi:hypothetical protein
MAADPVDEAAGRLYGLPLEDFTRERDARARELRKAKDREAAAAVGKLPKPSQAAWAANQLAREHRELIDALLAAGASLRDAQDAALAGRGSKQMRSAAAEERRAVDALIGAAKELRPAGRRPTDTTLDRLRTTLHAAAADEAVRTALDAGRLVEDAAGAGAWGLLGGGAEPPAEPRERKPKPKPTQETAKERKAREAAAEREAAEREERRRLEAELKEARAESRGRERELTRAEREAERAESRLEDAVAAAEQARAELDTARAAASEARDHVARLEERLD